MDFNIIKPTLRALFLTSIFLIACSGGGRSVIPRFAYVVNKSTNDVSAYIINASNGALTPIDADGAINGIQNFSTGTSPVSVSADPSGKFVYVANSVSGDVSAYTINATNGALTLIPCGSGPGCNVDNFLAGSSPNSITTNPSGKFAYVVNAGSGDISAYTIDAMTGALTQIPCGGGGCTGSNFTAGTYPYSVSIDPFGKFAYVVNLLSSDISAYTINATTGALTQIPCVTGCSILIPANFAAGINAISVTVDPSGTFAYVANTNSNDVSAYAINATTGELTRIPCTGSVGCTGSNFTAGSNPNAITVDPTGKFAYVVNNGSGDVSAYAINARTGALTQISCGGSVGCSSNNFTAGGGPTSVSVDPSSSFAYVANGTSNDVSAYAIDVSGALIPILCGAGASCNSNNIAFLAGGAPFSVTTTGKTQ